MTTTYAVEIEGLTKTYRNDFTAVSNLSMKVPTGVFGLLGPNGAGKTTTMQILVGAMRPSAGTARILGHDILKDSLASAKLVGYLPERPGFYDEMSGRRFLHYMGELSGLSNREASSKATELLEWAGLKGWGNSPISQYSAGMRQRLALAQSLINDPRVLFLDEPTANLDPLGRADFLNKVKELAGQGKTIVISTHIIPEMEQVADHVAIIAQGKLVVEGSIEELLHNRRPGIYRIGVSQPELLVKELMGNGFIAYLEDGQVMVETDKEKRLSQLVVAYCWQHKEQLRLFEPVRADLQQVFQKAIETAGDSYGP